VADENGWTVDSPESALHGGYVVRGCVEAVLGSNTLVSSMLGLVSFILFSFLYGSGEVNSLISRPLCAITPPATVLPVVKRNWRRFGRGDPGEGL
jgi:hypothetical protein